MKTTQKIRSVLCVSDADSFKVAKGVFPKTRHTTQRTGLPTDLPTVAIVNVSSANFARSTSGKKSSLEAVPTIKPITVTEQRRLRKVSITFGLISQKKPGPRRKKKLGANTARLNRIQSSKVLSMTTTILPNLTSKCETSATLRTSFTTARRTTTSGGAMALTIIPVCRQSGAIAARMWT